MVLASEREGCCCDLRGLVLQKVAAFHHLEAQFSGSLAYVTGCFTTRLCIQVEDSLVTFKKHGRTCPLEVKLQCKNDLGLQGNELVPIEIYVKLRPQKLIHNLKGRIDGLIEFCSHEQAGS